MSRGPSIMNLFNANDFYSHLYSIFPITITIITVIVENT